MNRVFADTSFYQALVNARDSWHSPAVAFSSTFTGSIVTTEYVLIELGSLMSRGMLRALYTDLVGALQADPRTEILPSSPVLFDQGLNLFRDRLDKDWSMTDCVSFVVMENLELRHALSCDRHFTQAGFTTLL